jgi:hypothetical protein
MMNLTSKRGVKLGPVAPATGVSAVLGKRQEPYQSQWGPACRLLQPRYGRLEQTHANTHR